MKVLHVIPSVAPSRGGPSAVLKTFVEGLSLQGVDVHVCTTDDNGPDRLNLDVSRPLQSRAVTYWYFPRQLRFYTVSIPLASWLSRHIADYDLVHIHALFSFPSTVASLIAKQRRVPYIIRPLGVLNEWGMRNRRRWLKKTSLKLIEGALIRRAALLHYTSDAERQQAAVAGVQAPSIVLPNPIPLTQAADRKGAFRALHGQLAGKKILLFLSRIDRKKGLELLLDAFAALAPAVAGFHLVIAGSGDSEYVDALKARAQALGVAAHILWTGFLSGESKHVLLADADLFVLPSYSENFGNAVAEALAAGLPVIVSENVGIHREIARGGAGLVVPCLTAPLTQAIERFFSTPELPPQMSIAATELARQAFSTDTVIQRLKACYEDVVQVSQRGPALHGELPAETC